MMSPFIIPPTATLSYADRYYVLTIAHRDCQVHLVTGGCTGHRYDKVCSYNFRGIEVYQCI